ncbi:MAG TPA: hypothetical protein VGC36_08165, partial [Rhizomicrobium sp.]
WLGDSATARHWLTAAIEHTPTTRWAYIGLALCEIIDGNDLGALTLLARGIERMDGTVGAAVYPVRAEALRRLGRLADARADLALALETNRGRLASWINLALLEAAVGDAAAQSAAFLEVRRRAAGLIADAAQALGVDAWLDDDATPDVVMQRRLLEHALLMLRGNRGSGVITYFRADGSLHALSPIDTDLARYDRFDLETSWSLLAMLAPQ